MGGEPWTIEDEERLYELATKHIGDPSLIEIIEPKLKRTEGSILGKLNNLSKSDQKKWGEARNAVGREYHAKKQAEKGRRELAELIQALPSQQYEETPEWYQKAVSRSYVSPEMISKTGARALKEAQRIFRLGFITYIPTAETASELEKKLREIARGYVSSHEPSPKDTPATYAQRITEQIQKVQESFLKYVMGIKEDGTSELSDKLTKDFQTLAGNKQEAGALVEKYINGNTDAQAAETLGVRKGRIPQLTRKGEWKLRLPNNKRDSQAALYLADRAARVAESASDPLTTLPLPPEAALFVDTTRLSVYLNMRLAAEESRGKTAQHTPDSGLTRKV